MTKKRGDFFCGICNSICRGRYVKMHLDVFHKLTLEEYWLRMNPEYSSVCSCGNKLKFNGMTKGFAKRCFPCSNKQRKQQMLAKGTLITKSEADIACQTLKALREKFSLEQMEKLMGYSQMSIKNWIRQKNRPRSESYYAIVQFGKRYGVEL